MDDLKTIRAHIERAVTHIAREHNTTNDVVWKQMLLASTHAIASKGYEHVITEFV